MASPGTVKVPDKLARLAQSATHLADGQRRLSAAQQAPANGSEGRKAELDSLVKASEQFTKAMKQSGVSQATLKVALQQPLRLYPLS